MSDSQSSFQRYEKKYLLTIEQYRALRQGLDPYMQADRYSRYTICSIYYDTDDFRLIRTSLAKPLYKEKLRLRSYGPAQGRDKVFVELKKKYDGVVYKRRVSLPAREAYRWLAGEGAPQSGQITGEIDWFRRRLPLSPKVFIGYDRQALAGREDARLRVTFDANLRWREPEPGLSLSREDGYLLLPGDRVLMEIKIPGAAPLWLSRALSQHRVFPSSFSKYGTYFKEVVLGGKRGGAYFKGVEQSA